MKRMKPKKRKGYIRSEQKQSQILTLVQRIGLERKRKEIAGRHSSVWNELVKYANKCSKPPKELLREESNLNRQEIRIMKRLGVISCG